MTGGKGKLIKDYVVGESVATAGDCQLAEGRRTNGEQVMLLIMEKRNLETLSFLNYNNLLQENIQGVHPRYLEIIQSTSNVYIILEKLAAPHAADPLALLPSLLKLYRSMGEYKLELSELYLNAHSQLVYLPLYKKVQMTSKFYAQFHNKSVLADLFCSLLPTLNKNTVLDIFIRNIDTPDALAVITREITREKQLAEGKGW